MQNSLDQVVKDCAKAFHLPGLSVGVYQGGKSYFSATGGRQGGRVDKETVYPIGSASKAFIAAVVMQLGEEGLLALDEPLVRYLPNLALLSRDEHMQGIALRRDFLQSILCDLHELLNRPRGPRQPTCRARSSKLASQALVSPEAKRRYVSQGHHGMSVHERPLGSLSLTCPHSPPPLPQSDRLDFSDPQTKGSVTIAKNATCMIEATAVT